jgi:6-phosphogluconate dehydrogenase
MQAMDIGLVGLGVMGENLALNLERNGFSVSGFDLNAERRKSFSQRTQGLRAQAVSSLPELVASLTVPRRIWMMVPAGAAVDQVLTQLRPLL